MPVNIEENLMFRLKSFNGDTANIFVHFWLRTWTHRCGIYAFLTGFPLLVVSACAPIRGFPDDPAARSELSSYLTQNKNGASVAIQIYGPVSETEYDAATDDQALFVIRNRIVRNRVHGYDVTYSEFKRCMAADANLISAGGSIAALIVGGIGATTGNGAAASALAAAGAGIVGAQGVINKDLYFQRTLPALLAQMDAARDRTIAAILNGLREPVSHYSLADANVDLERLKDAGSIEGAIGTITQDAAKAKADAQNEITRGPDYYLTRTPRLSVEQRIDGLTASQILNLANAAAGKLDQASPAAQLAARPYLPSSGTFASNQTTRARQFVTFWVEFETMTPDRSQRWNSAIDAVSK